MLVGKFPQKALPVLNKIRNEVKRPGMRNLRIDEDVDALRWFWKDGEYCPMGMLKCALTPAPAYLADLSEDSKITFNQMNLFATWFDKQTDKEAVVDFIWGI